MAEFDLEPYARRKTLTNMYGTICPVPLRDDRGGSGEADLGPRERVLVIKKGRREKVKTVEKR